MIRIKPELECILPNILDDIAGETLSKLHPVLAEQYIIDLRCSFNQFQPFCRPVHPDEAEGYEDISELDDYMVIVDVVDGLKLSIKKTPLCMKEKIEKSQKRLREWHNHCPNRQLTWQYFTNTIKTVNVNRCKGHTYERWLCPFRYFINSN